MASTNSSSVGSWLTVSGSPCPWPRSSLFWRSYTTPCRGFVANPCRGPTCRGSAPTDFGVDLVAKLIFHESLHVLVLPIRSTPAPTCQGTGLKSAHKWLWYAAFFFPVAAPSQTSFKLMLSRTPRLEGFEKLSGHGVIRKQLHPTLVLL